MKPKITSILVGNLVHTHFFLRTPVISMPKAALVTSSETQSLICLWKDQVAIFEVFIHSISRLDRLIIFLHRLGTRLSGFINSLQFIFNSHLFLFSFSQTLGPTQRTLWFNGRPLVDPASLDPSPPATRRSIPSRSSRTRDRRRQRRPDPAAPVEGEWRRRFDSITTRRRVNSVHSKPSALHPRVPGRWGHLGLDSSGDEGD